MRIRGRVMGYTIDIQRDYSDMYTLGRLTPVMMPGAQRRIMRLEIEVLDMEGPPDRQGGYCDINIIAPGDTVPAPAPVRPVTTSVNQPSVDRAVENIRRLSNAMAAMAVGVVRRGGPSPVEVAPKEPEKPKDPPPPTRWSMLEID